MSVAIYVINIPTSVSRRKSIEDQFYDLGLSCNFFAAVDGKVHNHPLFNKYNKKKRLSLKGKLLVGGQLGCFASHYLLWEKCISDDKPIIVLEDDAKLKNDNFMEFYNNVQNLQDHYECIRLFESYGKKRKGIKVGKVGGLEIFKYSKGYMGTIGYYLTPPAAKKFIKGAQEWFLTVDIYMDRFWSNRVEYYGVSPACLSFDPVFSSDIDYTLDRQKRNIMVKVRRELFLLSEAVRRLSWNIGFRIRYFLSSSTGNERDIS